MPMILKTFVRLSNCSRLAISRPRTLCARTHRKGLLTFEWIIAITLLVLAIVGGYTAIRDGLIDELGDICGAMLSVDQSFETHAPADLPCAGSWGSWQDDDAAQQIQRGRNL